VSQVQILGLAPEAWSCQSDRRAAFSRSENKYFNRTAQSDVMIFIFHSDKFVIGRLQSLDWTSGLDWWTDIFVLKITIVLSTET